MSYNLHTYAVDHSAIMDIHAQKPQTVLKRAEQRQDARYLISRNHQDAFTRGYPAFTR